jgi:hypothetical protein
MERGLGFNLLGFRVRRVSRRPRGVKKVERSPWPMNSEVASSTAAQFSVEIEFRQSDAGQKVRQNRATAQLTSHRCIEIGAAWNE